MSDEIKELTITYTVQLATYNPDAVVAAQENLYELFDDVFFRTAEGLMGACFLTKNTQLTIEGKK